MKKKRILPVFSAIATLGVLCAFSYPEKNREQVWTLFFPDRAAARAATPEEISARPAVRPVLVLRDTLEPLKERKGDFVNDKNQNVIDLKDPKIIEQKVDYDPATGMYIVSEKIGEDYYRAPTYMTFNEYLKWRDKKQQQEYFDRLQGAAGGGKKSGLADPIAKFDIKNSLIERLFGGSNVDIRPQGNINLTFGVDYQKVQNPILTLRQQSFTQFDFDMDINMSAAGKIGEKLNLNFNYNTQATFDFDNQMKLSYDAKNFSEDEILQNIEAGNVSMPLRSNLIKGAQNLFGIKTEMKFGHLRTTLVASQQRSRQQSITLQGGAQVQQFNVPIDEYDENRHFFISHWNRGQFEPALKCLPVPQSLFNITRMEVWLTNDRLATENVRDIVAFSDLAEPNPYLDGTQPSPNPIKPNYRIPNPIYKDITGNPLPANQNNRLYPQILSDLNADSSFRQSDKVIRRLTSSAYGLKQIQDFEKVRARLLSNSEYTFNEQLGFVSVNLNVQPDQVVGVALEYTYNGIPYKIGEFTSDIPNGDTLNQNVLFVKMLKSTTANVRFPIWDLMMKNVYAVGAANVDPQEFRFDIFYEDPGKGQKRFLNSDDVPTALRTKPLLQVFNLDNLNLQGDPGADGIFDFVPGLTINLRSGRVMFPVLEPFGRGLQKELLTAGMDSIATTRYVYPQLYDSTLFRAREFQQLNRFSLRGNYKSSSSSEISLGTFNLPQGSVRVSVGGIQLQPGDYEVDYNIGKVRILNDAVLQSGQNVTVSFEDNTLFGFQARTMVGARFDYEFSKDLTVGGTFMNLYERPLTQKVNFGDDPINNRMYGVDFNLSKDAPWLTKMVDRLPLISTKAPSSITAQAEIAALDPGYNRAINQNVDQGGVVYVDDFEGSTANLPLTFPANSWVAASVPQNDDLFPENNATDSLALSANRARLSWYVIDPGARDQVDGDNPYTRIFQYQDIFPNRQLAPTEQSILRPLDITIFPKERGPYNYEIPGGYPGFSHGFTKDGQLARPETRWAGFMRGLNNNDFEAANIEFIEFWMLNPYMDKEEGISEAGDMYIDLGTLSEDVMRDSRQFFENALPTGGNTGATARTAWGRVPVLPPVVVAFDNDPRKRVLQDVGLDGCDDEAEKRYFDKWLTNINNSSDLSPNAKAEINADPSNDNFVFYRDDRFEQGGAQENPGILTRYRKFNNQQGNSPDNSQNANNFNASSNTQPDMEDLNRDNTLNETEAYFRYKIHLAQRGSGADGILDTESPSLRDLITDTVEVFSGGRRHVWYRFKLPLDWKQRQQIGGIQDFRSIRFIRVFWKNFTEQTTFRFASFELGRNQWRRFLQAVPDPSKQGCDVVGQNQNGIPFDINAVSIEENAARTPFNYTIPYGISRENSVGAFPDILQNEQAMSVSVCDLTPCDARAVFKTLNMDLRQFQRLKMFVHGEAQNPMAAPLGNDDIAVFIRLGSDFYNNYYEYEVPLTLSDPLSPVILGGNPDTKEYKEEVWRPENTFDFPLELLTDIKKKRNAQPNFPAGEEFYMPDPDKPGNIVKIKGNPNLGLVKGAMIGIRNVDNEPNSHCVEVWLNEMRLTGFNDQGGYAGLARVDMKLADLGNVSVAGNYSSIGWGGIDQRLIQRQREEVIQYDISANVELGKLLPEKVGLKLPIYTQYSNTTRNPQFDPYDLDIELKDKLRETADPIARDSIKRTAQDVTTIRGFNFTNVRKERKGGARKIPLPWNIENFSLSYAQNVQSRRTPFIISDDLKQRKGILDYQYNTGLKPISPFKKLIKKDKYLKFLSEFNLNPIPNSYGFSSNLERIEGITTWRFSGEDPKNNTYYNRRFTWDRNYDLNWDIAKSLRFNFDANARSLIDEPLQYRPDGQPVSATERRDSILTNLRSLGRPKNYQHNAALNWTLPFKTIPFMEFINVRASYTTGYTWSAQSLKLQNLDAGSYQERSSARNLGNVIQNTATRQINGDLNFETLYNKSKYLAKINKPVAKKPAKKKEATDGQPAAEDGAGDKTADKKEPRSDRRKSDKKDDIAVDAGADKKAKKDAAAKTKDKTKEREPSMAERIALRPLMLVRKARFTYNENYATVVPGFIPDTKLMGLSEGFNAPGWGFVAGLQPGQDWLEKAGEEGWITHRPELNQQVNRNFTQNFDAGATIEPFRDFRIELSANRQYTRNSTELFKDQSFNLAPDSVDFQHRAARDLGSFTVSYFAMNTMFNNDITGLFRRFQNNRPVISDRLGRTAGNTEEHDQDNGYVKGYGRIQQEVLVPAFIAAYTEKDPGTVGLDIFKTLPSVNWKLNYNGLSKVGNLSKIFQSVQIAHGYKSTLTVNSYNTDIFYTPAQPYTIDTLNFNYVARFEIPQIVINEVFQPLLGIDVKLKNDMSFKADFKKSRNLQMSFIDYQLAEGRSSSYTVGFGYRMKNVNIPFLTGKKTKKTTSKSKKKSSTSTAPAPPAGAAAPQGNDMNFKFDMEVRDDVTLNHRLDQADAVPTRGARTISINPSVDYQLNRRLKMRLFTDYRRTVPKTSQSFPITTLNAGVTVQFLLN